METSPKKIYGCQISKKFKVKPQWYFTTHFLEWLIFSDDNTKVLENSLADSYEAKHTFINDPAIPLSGTTRYLPKRSENLSLHQHLYVNGCNRFIHNLPELAATLMFTNHWTDKRISIQPQNVILLMDKINKPQITTWISKALYYNK